MKDLLRSKKFQKNLRKWLILYIGVLALLSSVVTYSKYITSLESKDSARVAKFDVSVLACSIDEEGKQVCNTGKMRPTSVIEYVFTLKPDVEVKTDVFLTMLLNDKFILRDLSVIKDGKETSMKSKFLSHCVDSNGNSIDCKDKDLQVSSSVGVPYTWKESIDAGSSSQFIYHVKVQYNNCPNKDVCENNEMSEDYSNILKDLYDIVRIGYSAIQKNR